jgi:uncharacterized protein (DUF952 family)
MLDRIVYKIMSASELEQTQRDGVFCGSPADIADGYIHLSCGSQLEATLDKHFSGVDGLMLVAVDLSRLGDTVRWEAARGGQLWYRSRLWSEPLTEWSGCPPRAWLPRPGTPSPSCRPRVGSRYLSPFDAVCAERAKSPNAPRSLAAMTPSSGGLGPELVELHPRAGDHAR